METKETQADDVEVLIVGAGFSGLSAARALAAQAVKVRVVDAFADHLGGRAYSYDAPEPEGTSLRYDHGAQYVGDLQNEIMAQIRELIGEDELVNGAALRKPYPFQVMYLDQERLCFRFDQSKWGITGVPEQLTPWETIQMLSLLAEMTLIEMYVDIVEPWNSHASLLELDQVTIADWIADKWWVGARVRDLVTISVEALLSVEPSEISPLYLLWYTACNEGFVHEINDDTGGPQQYWLRHGTDALAKRYAEPIADRIRSGAEVTAIDSGGERVVATLADGSRIEADRVIVATSPASAGRSIDFTPELPEARRTMMTQPMGRTLKCQVYYRSSWWHQGAGGIAYNGYVGGANYPVLWVMDNSPLDADTTGGPHVLMTFTVGAQLDQLGSSPTHDEVVAWVTGTLAKQFEDERALSTSPEFIRLESYLWNPEQSEVGGGPNTIFTPGTLTGPAGRLLEEPHDGAIYFACAETSRNAHAQSKYSSWHLLTPEKLPKYGDDRNRLPHPAPPYATRYSDHRKSLGYMDGAMHAGDYVARQVAADLGKDVELPAPPERAPHVMEGPPPRKNHAPEDLVAVMQSVTKALAASVPDDVKAFAEEAAATAGSASWLRERLLDALREVGGDDDPVTLLAALRDLGPSLHHVRTAKETAPAHHVTAIESTLKEAEEHLARLFG